MARPSFAAGLKQARTKAGLSQAALALRAGLTAPYISLLEGGRRRPPLPAVIERLAKALALDAAPWLDQAALERTPGPIRKRLEGLDRAHGRVQRARDGILTTALYRLARMPGLLAGVEESLEGTSGFKAALNQLSARLRGIPSVGEARAQSAELLGRLPASDRDRLIDALPDVLPAPTESVAAEEVRAVAPLTSIALEVRTSLKPSAHATGHLHVDARWVSAGAFLWRLESDDAHPQLEAGDLLLVDPSRPVRDGELVALHHQGRDLVRRVQRRADGELRLEGLRPETAPLRLGAASFEPAGVVRHVLRSLS